MSHCYRPGCEEPVLAWLHPRYCSRYCAEAEGRQRPMVRVIEPPPIPPVPPVPKPADLPPDEPGWLARLLERMLR